MPDPKSRAKIERLLRGDFRPGDLTDLFLFARDHCDGREPVAEIGHFVAHHQEREKGIITRSTREWFAVARYHLSRFGPGGPYQFDGEKMPSATRDYFKIAVNRIEAKIILEKTGLRRAAAHQIMIKLADRLGQNQDGTWSLPNDLTKNELSLVQCLSSNIVVKPAFEDDRLFDDFAATLKSNGLISKEELHTNKDDLKTLVQLYAVSAMHNCLVQIGDGTTTQLKARPEPKAKQIMVNSTIRIAVPNAPTVSIACSMFTANLDPNVHCHPNLIATQDWDFEIEVAPDKRISPLR